MNTNELLERIAVALERCADALNAADSQFEIPAPEIPQSNVEYVDTDDGRIPVTRAAFS